MNLLNEAQCQTLIAKAQEAALQSYSPYSHFHVGSALLTNDGRILLGTNLENASYGLTICAERNVIGQAVSAGTREFKAIAVWSVSESLSPCGACRQFIREFGPDIIVIFKQDKAIMQKTISELLPYAFSEKELK
jgi:cytidine deaminase